jgi:membrane associated rhomboid family serine protease
MREAPVGWQCPQCIHDDHRRAPVTHWRPSGGGTLGASRLTPLVMALVALNAVIFLYEETNFDSIVFRFALIPAFTTNEPYRLVTAAFLHASFTHILLNMVGLIVIGPAVESAVGRTRFVILYLLAAVGGEVASYLVGPLNEVSLGASGAVFGLFGAYYVLARRRRWDTQIVLVFIAINLAYSFLDTSIDWRAHVGGLAVGAGVAAIYNRCESLPAVTRPWVETAAYAGVLVAIAVLSRLPAGHIGV